MEKELKYLLQKIGILKERYDIKRDEEEKFNIFSVMYKEHDERRLHSRFIATLLNPVGSHGVENLFLKNFIEDFEYLDFINFKNAVVYPEEWNKKENNNIDILIIDRSSKYAIIIENKIYAGDSNNESGGQLERYYKHVRDSENIPKNNISVFYLTLDGHDPSNESLGDFKTLEKINGQCISYENNIITWLKTCLKGAYDKPFLRESILQYVKLINKMTNNETDIEERLKIKDIISQNKDSMTAAKYLIDNFKHVKWHTIDHFWSELENEFVDKGLEIIKNVDKESITQLTHYYNNKREEEGGITIRINEELECFIWHEKDEPLFWGFEENKINYSQKKALEKLTKDQEIEEVTGDYWWNYFEFPDNDKLWLKDFSNEKTFNLIDPIFRKKTILKIVEDILEFIDKKMNIVVSRKDNSN